MMAYSLAYWLIGIGLFLMILGLLHTTRTLSQWDAQTFLWLHTRLRRSTGFFRYFWPLGTVPVGITLISIMFIASWQAGFCAALTYFLAAISEWVIKRKVRRPRPFETLPGVVMSQPKHPRDPSHPSGDTMRGWFLALVFPMAFGLPWWVFALTGLVALTLGIGRIVLGVHYPLDIIGGAGLGILFTGLFILSYDYSVISLQSSVLNL